MQRELKLKANTSGLNPIEEMRMGEIQFAIANLNKRSIFKTTTLKNNKEVNNFLKLEVLNKHNT